MTKHKGEKKSVEVKKKQSKRSTPASSTDDDEEAQSSTRPSGSGPKKNTGTLSSSEASASASTSSGSSSGSSSSSSSSSDDDDDNERDSHVSASVPVTSENKGKVKKKSGTNSPSPNKGTSSTSKINNLQQSPSVGSSTGGHGIVPSPKSNKSSQQPHSTKKKSHKKDEIVSTPATSSKLNKKEKVGKVIATKVPTKGVLATKATPKKSVSQNGTPVKLPPSGKKMPGSVKAVGSGNDNRSKGTPGKANKVNKSISSAGGQSGKHVPKVNGGKVPPRKHQTETPKTIEKKLEISSSTNNVVGMVTRRGSRSTSCSSSASASSATSSTDSSSESSNESAASKSNDETNTEKVRAPGSTASSSKAKISNSRLSSTSTSTSTSGSGSSSSSSSEDDDDESEKTPVVRAPPAPPAKTAQNRLSKKDEATLKKNAKPRKKPAASTVTGNTSNEAGSESKVIKTRSSSSCSSSLERSSAASTTSSSSARSRSSTKRRAKVKSTKTELSIASCTEESQVPDVIQKHWQQIPRVKAKPPTTTTLFIPSSSTSDKDAKGSPVEDNETENEQASSRPVTRRQISNKKKTNKTIPTTTKFSLDKLHEKLECSSSSPRVVYNEASDSDYSCGSGGDNQIFIRCVPAKSSLSVNKKAVVEDTRVCMFPGCDSNGHLSGLYDKHCLISCCPKYHIDSGFFLGRGEEESRTEDVDPGSGEELGPTNPAEECQQLSRMRSNRMTARSHYTPASSNPLTLIPTSNHQKLFKNPNKHHPQPQEVKQWINKMKELKDTKLDSNISEYDMSLWRDALALAAAQIESEQNASVQFNKWSLAMGKFEMGCWCCNPYPEPLAQLRRIFICEFCLKPVQSGTVLRRHCAKCVWRHPPGDEIYRKERLSVWEVDGKTQKTYCQYLCLLAKCFLDHKTLYLDVDPFLFYVMTIADSQGCHIVGYFSKEKNSFLNYNVSCILTLPPYMRQGFGRLLIDFSYLLTRVEGKIGSPEKPLSDLGLISYRSYWKDAVLRRMCACASRDVGVKELSQELGIASADLVSTLQFLGMLKYWKGKHLVLKKQDVLEEYLDRVRRRGVEQRQIDSSCLRWRPYQPPPDNSQSKEEPSSISSILNSVVGAGGGASTE